MGEIQPQRPVLLIAAVSSRYESAIEEWTREKSQAAWGQICLESPLFDFTETNFYTASMGEDLKKKFFAYEKLLPPEDLPDTKILSNELEQLYADSCDHPESRPLNIDTGYITEAKLVLATTKDRDHRIYLRDGIFAEITLHYSQQQWIKSRWTYPDYQRDDFHSYFTSCREYLRQRYRDGTNS